MRVAACVLLACAGAIGVAQTACAQSPWYVEGSAGALWRSNANRSTIFNNALGITGPGTETVTYNPGPVFNLGLGYRLPLGFRVEAEGGYAHYSIDTVSPLSTDGTFPTLNGSSFTPQSGGGRDQYSGKLNAFYDLPFSGWIVPYVGAGLGVYVNKSQTTVVISQSGSRLNMAGGSSTNSGVLAEVGLNIILDSNWSVVPSYRFEHLFTKSGAAGNDANILKLGFRYAL